jgi:hypothetical protein
MEIPISGGNMNQRNVDALADLYSAWLDNKTEYVLRGSPVLTTEVARREFGEFLASCGVLVPLALTEEQIGTLRALDESTTVEPVEWLERVAKGEQP